MSQFSSLSEWPVYQGFLGARASQQRTQFAVWSPQAQRVQLRLFHTDNPSDQPFALVDLAAREQGAWEITLPDDYSGTYYDYAVQFAAADIPADLAANDPQASAYNASNPNIITHYTSDPWGVASGANGERSMVADISRINPEGWERDASPHIPLAETVIWETHVGDFSNDPAGGFPPEHRGKFLAFTDETALVTSDNNAISNTAASGDVAPTHAFFTNVTSTHAASTNATSPTVSRETVSTPRSIFPTGMAYLRQLGVTHVQIMPMYDYGSVDETLSGNAYNWGYDPVAYNVPEGSYSTNPHDGATRIRECKALIAALHRNGFRVIMDVVFNHMYTPHHAFERMAPGYFMRHRADGALLNGSGCGNDMASERPMYRRFILDSLRLWVQEYHVDGFRFDLMALIDVETMNEARAMLDALPHGKDILMFGEPWAADASQNPEHLVLSDMSHTALLNPRIGWFCDATRDSIKGSVMQHTQPGYVNGAASHFRDAVAQALNAWRGTQRAPQAVQQLIQYVSSHDDLTLWDKLCLSMREQPTEADFEADVEAQGNAHGNARDDAQGDRHGDACGDMQGDAYSNVLDIIAANAMAAGLVLTSAGIPFMLSGEEFARTKHGCSNSYNQPAALNWLDWRRAERLQPLVDWYRELIALRRAHHALFDAPRTPLPTNDDTTLAVLVTNTDALPSALLIIAANPTAQSTSVALPPHLAAHTWHCIADSSLLAQQFAASSANSSTETMPTTPHTNSLANTMPPTSTDPTTHTAAASAISAPPIAHTNATAHSSSAHAPTDSTPAAAAMPTSRQSAMATLPLAPHSFTIWRSLSA